MVKDRNGLSGPVLLAELLERCTCKCGVLLEPYETDGICSGCQVEATDVSLQP